MENEVRVFVPGEKVKHKLGFLGVIHGVKKELRGENGAILQELQDEEAIYLVGYLANGKVEMLQVNYQVLDKYVE